MICLTTPRHESLMVNVDSIECIEGEAETVLCLTTGQQVRVLETADEVVEKVIAQWQWRIKRHKIDAAQ